MARSDPPTRRPGARGRGRPPRTSRSPASARPRAADPKSSRPPRTHAVHVGRTFRGGLHASDVENVKTPLRAPPVQIARQIKGAAQPEEILATRTAKDVIVGSGIQFAERDTHPLADDDETGPPTPSPRPDPIAAPADAQSHPSQRRADRRRRAQRLLPPPRRRVSPCALPPLEPGLSAAPPTPAPPRPGSGRLRPRTRDARLGRAASVPRRHRLTPASVEHRQRREADHSRLLARGGRSRPATAGPGDETPAGYVRSSSLASLASLQRSGHPIHLHPSALHVHELIRRSGPAARSFMPGCFKTRRCRDAERTKPPLAPRCNTCHRCSHAEPVSRSSNRGRR